MVQLQRLVVAPAQISEQHCVLTSEQQHYLSRVLRLRQGDRFIVMNGQGQSWLAVLSESLAAAQLLEALAAATELPVPVTLAVALPKGNGMDDIVRQTTELGVTYILPILSDRTLLKPSAQKLDRWRRIAQEAAEQSERQTVPTVFDPIPLTAHLQDIRDQPPQRRYICAARRSAPALLSCLLTAPTDLHLPISVATGPEGGWTDAEVEMAIAAGYQPVSLGCRILRAVTAPITALSLIAATVEFPTS